MRHGRWTAAIAFAAAALTGCGAEPPPLEDQFLEAEALVLDGDWPAAEAALKQVLLREPSHAGAHYYLARTFFLQERFVGAEGEIQTALHYFHEGGETNPIPRFDSAEYFEIACYTDLSRILSYQFDLILELITTGPPRRRGALAEMLEILDERLALWEEVNQKAAAIAPDREEVELSQRLRAQRVELLEDVREEILRSIEEDGPRRQRPEPGSEPDAPTRPEPNPAPADPATVI